MTVTTTDALARGSETAGAWPHGGSRDGTPREDR